jgi:predicted RNase H-like nuclease
MSKVMGIDAAAGEWLAVLLVGGRYAGSELQPSIAALVSRHFDAEVIAIDIPIGLPDRAFRPADEEARRFVGRERAASVFRTFPREVLEATSHAAAGAIAKRLLGTGLSLQSYALRDRIFEVEPVALADHRVREVHPEVSFRALKGAPLVDSKHCWNGLNERQDLLAKAGILLPGELPGAGRAAPDDIVDAAVAAWSALRIAEGRSETLPAVRPSDPSRGGVIHY